MKISVIGAGTIGAAIARELCARADEVDQVQVCDTRSRALQALHDTVSSRTLRSFQVDARDTNVLSQILRGSDCVISCVPPELNPGLARLCLNAGVNFCDLGGNDSIVQKELALSDEAREKSVWIVPNCGLAPGLLNVLCMHGIEQFDKPKAAYLRVGDVPLEPQEPFNFRISWSAERILDDYTNPAQHIRDGRVVKVDALTGTETIGFGEEPFRDMEAFCTQGGLSTLTESLEGKVETLDHKTIRWPGHAHQMRFVIGLGLGEDRKIGVRTHLTYRDVLVRRMRDRLGGDYADAVLMRVVIHGMKDGREQSLVYEMIERYDEETSQTAMMRATAIPTVVVARLVSERGYVSGGGADVPENVVPHDVYMEKVSERGLDIREEWHEGHVDVAGQPSLQKA
ncbi:saccharopine dehydrogenase [Longibacter salinarum]|uniref:Saccharopine dehydrogenase n=1 Tax=Longibacter salinarum TaxID=1850348 RepID=A0A2A8CX06_9BACT|nr:saccharopine dehydrogenase C-terminal domain-containing protein [Longibacter salinarum]PEN13235.1 saccharopine dehydrogenase [Longibacter salinarum]